jgi:hypothetical protein
MRLKLTLASLFLLLAVVVPQPFLAQTTATKGPIAPTQAVIQFRGSYADCTIDVSRNADMSSPLDNLAADEVLWDDGTLNLVIGRLQPATPYFTQAHTCAEESNILQFTTPTLSNGTTQTQYGGFNPACWGNLNLCTDQAFDWTDPDKLYQDPQTGVTIKILPTNYYDGRTGGTSAGQGFNCANWTGGTSWTTPENVCSGTTATVGNTNPLDVYLNLAAISPNPVTPYGIYQQYLQDIGVVPTCGGSGSAGADTTLEFQLIVHGTPVNEPFVVQCQNGAPAHVLSGNSDPDQAFPVAFPTMPFYGWSGSGSPAIHQEDQITYGTVSVSGSTLTISSPNKNQHFSSALVPGDQIYLEGPGSCTNGLYAVDTNISAASITVVGTPGNGCTTFRAYGWGIRVSKLNANGTVTLSLKFKVAASQALGMPPGGDKCAKNPVTSGDGKVGYPCVITPTANDFVNAFIANDGTTRIYSVRKSTQALQNPQGLWIDPADSTILWQAQNAGVDIYMNRLTYGGDYTANIDYDYDCNLAYTCPSFDDQMTVVNIMASAGYLGDQIAANWSMVYDESIYGAWEVGQSVQFIGVTGGYAIFQKFYGGGGQDTGPVWIAWVNLTTGEVDHMCHTLDGNGCEAWRYAAGHSSQPMVLKDDLLFFSGKRLVSGAGTVMHGGPFQATPTGVLLADGVTWDTNTCLDWTPNSGTGCAHRGTSPAYVTCPVNSYGYIQCVTLRMPLICNTAPTVAELANFPACPWNAAYTLPVTMQAGDLLYNAAAVGDYDSEHFRILSMTPIGGDLYSVVMGRNAVWDYCSIAPWHGVNNPTSADAANQFQHSNGFSIRATSGNWNSCGDLVSFWKLDEGFQSLGAKLIGHFEIGANTGATLNYITQPVTLYQKEYTALETIPPPYLYSGISFEGVSANVGTQSGLQSYTDQSMWQRGELGYQWSLDTNPQNPPGSFETIGGGPTRTLTPITGDVYRIAAIGSGTQSVAGYKVSPMTGWAGRYQLQDVSGPSCDITAEPYTMGIVVIAEECYPGSTAGQIYINVPQAYDPEGRCTSSVSWANIPCVVMGNHGPDGAIRQFGVSRTDRDGYTSRLVSMGLSSPGRAYPYTHSLLHPSGDWAIVMGINIVDGFMPAGFLVSLPPMNSANRDPGFRKVVVQVPAGSDYAEVRFGYNQSLYCTARSEACATPGSPYSFIGETRTLTSCAMGCTITIPALADKIVYYQIWRGDMSNGSDAAASSEIKLSRP